MKMLGNFETPLSLTHHGEKFAAQCCQSGTHNVWLQRIQAHLLQQALRDFQDVTQRRCVGLGFWVLKF